VCWVTGFVGQTNPAATPWRRGERAVGFFLAFRPLKLALHGVHPKKISKTLTMGGPFLRLRFSRFSSDEPLQKWKPFPNHSDKSFEIMGQRWQLAKIEDVEA